MDAWRPAKVVCLVSEDFFWAQHAAVRLPYIRRRKAKLLHKARAFAVQFLLFLWHCWGSTHC